MKTRAPRAKEAAPASGDGARGERRRRMAPLALGAAAVAVAGTAAAALLGGDGGNGGSGIRGGGSTVAVTRQTLVARELVEGTLGYAGTRTLLNRLETSGSGTPSESPATADSASGTTPTVIHAAYFTPDNETSKPDSGDGSHDDPTGNEPDQGDSAPRGSDPDEPAPDDKSAQGTPDESEPDGSSPDGSQQGGSQQGGSQQGGSQQGGSQQGGSQQGGSQQGGSQQGGSQQGGSQQGGSQQSRSSSGGGSSTGDSGATGSGTVTALPRPGSVVRRGRAVYRLDGEPVVLMYGSTPAYRDLDSGVSDGRDVRQLEQNLAALGFDPGTIDTSFTSTTADAVADWQESVGLPETGSVELGRVVFLPGARRIGEHHTSVGSVLSAGAEVLDTSSTRRVVTVELDAALQSIARKGDRVEVTLPDQSTVRGRITDVGRVAREKESEGDPAAGDTGTEQELVIDVTVRLRSVRRVGRLDEAPVSVGLAQESRKNALSVPVEALVARRGGGYGVELAAGRRVVPVETGLFAGGYVEIEGSGIREGTRVVVPDA
jgi:Putative peptidoglycan binding domain